MDFQKAFDSLEWPFIQKVFKHYDFGPSLTKWLYVFYNDIQSCVVNSGWSSSFCSLNRGVRQGCPLSPYIFIICAEVLATAIRKDKKIKGISIKGDEIKISQYVDDTTLFLDGSKASLQESLRVLDRFSQISGLKLNVTKTEVLWFGSLSGKTDVLFPERKLKWTTNKVKALGTYFSTKAEEAWKQNFQEKIEKPIRKLTENWSFRRLSLLGKVTVIKTLLASQLVYILTPLPTCHMAIKEINDLFYKFLWDGKGDKIKRTVVINGYQEGGIKMLDIKSFNSALKATWIPKYLDVNNKGKWKIVFKYWLSRIQKENIFTYNLSRKVAQAINVDDKFLQELIEIWAEVNFQGKLRSLKEFEEQTLWHNSLIRIENEPAFYNHWFSKLRHLQSKPLIRRKE